MLPQLPALATRSNCRFWIACCSLLLSVLCLSSCTSIHPPHRGKFKFVYIDKTGKPILEPHCDYAWMVGSFHQGLALVEAFKQPPAPGNNLFGYIDKRGNIALRPQLFKATNFSDGLAAVEFDWSDPRFLNSEKNRNGYWGYIDSHGNEKLMARYQYAYPFSNDRALTVANVEQSVDGFTHMEERYDFIDKAGAPITKEKYLCAESFFQGLAAVQVKDKWGYINCDGKMQIAPTFDDARFFAEDLAPVRIGSRWGYIDRSGQMAIAPAFEDACPFSEGLAVAYVKDSAGFIDKHGKFVIKPQFQWARSFSEGLAAVRVADQWGFIDKSGKLVIAPYLEAAQSFSEGLAAVVWGSDLTSDQSSKVERYEQGDLLNLSALRGAVPEPPAAVFELSWSILQFALIASIPGLIGGLIACRIGAGSRSKFLASAAITNIIAAAVVLVIIILLGLTASGRGALILFFIPLSAPWMLPWIAVNAALYWAVKKCDKIAQGNP